MIYSFKQKDSGLKALQDAVKALKGKPAPYVKVGLLGGPKDRRPGEKIGNVELGIVHEFGAPSKGIPERSFIRAPFHKKRREYLRLLKSLVKAGLRTQGMGILKALAVVGEKMAADFKASAPGTPPPNAPETLRRKLALTRPGSKGEPKTLVDTGRMIQSITYAVVKDGK